MKTQGTWVLLGLGWLLLSVACSESQLGIAPTQEPEPLRWNKVQAEGPSARWGARALWDGKRQRMLLFGGVSVRRFDDLWAFDLRTQQWTELTQAKGPSPRDTGLFVLHPSGDRAFYYGGRTGTYADPELWSLDLTSDTWTRLGEGPPGRFEFAYATHGDRVWLYGGNLLHGIETDELWEMDLSSVTFRKLPVGRFIPPKSTSPGLMALSDAVFLTGGHDNAGRVGFGTWKYDLNNSAWEPVTTEGSLPSEAHFAYVVDTTCSEVLLHGGDNSDGQDRQELVAWSPILSKLAVLPTEGEQPAPRRHHAAVWVPEQRTLLLFGGWAGIQPTDTFFGDTWTLQLPSCAFTRGGARVSPRLAATPVAPQDGVQVHVDGAAVED